ncbi:MAG: TonB-dependent receptor [Dysgonamonadaceae bacterium]|nr:TonB-dependent receptor [Dysgonamonadaceae bacterium]MDD3309015.1 TonB-dependent receptor [Dysgonamonadaceae bacterium]MDD3900514.1 TonB-dependent receptor [Dysgonamonadaceae bacterium]
MKNKIILLLILALISSSALFAQQISVKGTVVDSKTNEALIGVAVLEKGTNNGTVTNIGGVFNLSVPKGATLHISYVGYTSKEVNAEETQMTISLEEDTKLLDEVVVIGYGTAAKRDITGSIVKVSAKDLAGKPNTNPVSSLQGKVSGLSVVNSGQPGSEPDIRIRGTVSINQTKPLYIVDGIFNDNINFVNPADIESMEVLKDPSSLAIFGVRGANGVIIVTTKKGQQGKVTVNLSSSIGVKNIVGTPQMTNRNGFTTLYDEQRANQGASPYTEYSLFNGNTNWIDQIANRNAIVNYNNISITSGTEKNKFYLGLGYIDENGLIKNENYNKFTISINDELNISKYLKLGVGVNGSKASLPQMHDFISALNATPIVEPFNSENKVYNKLPDQIGGPQIGNPLMFVEGNKFTQIANEYRFVGNAFLEYIFLKNFTFKMSYFADLGFNDGRGYTPLFKVYNAESSQVVNWNTKSGVSQYRNAYTKYQQDYLLTYKNQFGYHGLTLLGGFTTYFEDFNQINGSITQYAGGNPIPYDKRWWYLNVYPYGDPESQKNSSAQWERSTLSTLFRALYNYKNKYNVSASFRRDGSSEISPSHRFQNFWALGGAWYVTEEDFMKNQTFFSNLKVKASIGQLGNQYTGVHYPYYPNYTEGSTAVFGENLVPAYVLAYKNNPNLKWETVDAYEGGVEMDVLKNKLHFEANYYEKRTKDLLTMVNDGANNFYMNAGSVKSSGLEFLASWNEKVNEDFGYSITGNLTTMNNKVLSVWKDGYKYYSGNSITEAGYPIGYFYGYVVDGIYQSFADKLASPVNTLGEYGPGDLKFKDISGPDGVPDGKITSDDRTKIGNPTPDLTYGISGSINYKNFDFAVDLQGVYGNEVWRAWGNGSTYSVFNYRQARMDRWTEAGSSNWEPRVGNDAINNLPSNYMIEDGSYIRLRNVQLGYSVPKNAISKLNITSLRFYLSGQNLVTWKHNSGFTPEAGGSAISFGIDNGGYPIPAITSLGFNITF